MEGPKGETEREAVNFAFVDAKLVSLPPACKANVNPIGWYALVKVTSPLHIQTAVYQSILAAAQGSLLTKTVHSEVIWYLNPTNNVCPRYNLRFRKQWLTPSPVRLLKHYVVLGSLTRLLPSC